jgi:DME family drug/metabolite transporter
MSRSTVAQSRLALILVAVAATLWGTVGVATRQLVSVDGLPVTSIGFFRLALAVPVLLVACVGVRGRGLWQARGREIGLIATIGAMLGLYQLCFIQAVVRAGVTIATLVTLCAAPIMVMLFDTLLTRQWPNRWEAGALGAALVGTALLVGTPSAEAGQIGLGAVYALGSALGYAIMLMCGRHVADRAHPLQINALAFGIGAAILLVFTLPRGPVVQVPLAGWGLLFYLGLVPTALGYVLFLRGVRDIPATRASIITLIEPLTAALLAWGLFGEHLSGVGWAGALLLVAALGGLMRQQIKAE